MKYKFKNVTFTLFWLLTSCASSQIHNQTNTFLDIEVDNKNIWIGCTEIDPKDGNSLMTFYILDGDTTHEFKYRSVREVNECLELEREYRSMTNGVSSVRIVGIQPLTKNGSLINERLPESFKTSRVNISWTFVRYQTKNGCKSYLEGYCSPDKYWGGVSYRVVPPGRIELPFP